MENERKLALKIDNILKNFDFWVFTPWQWWWRGDGDDDGMNDSSKSLVMIVCLILNPPSNNFFFARSMTTFFCCQKRWRNRDRLAHFSSSLTPACPGRRSWEGIPWFFPPLSLMFRTLFRLFITNSMGNSSIVFGKYCYEHCKKMEGKKELRLSSISFFSLFLKNYFFCSLF